MKNQLWTVMLIGLLGVTVLAAAILTLIYVQSTRKLNKLQVQANVITQYRSRMHALANEAVDYSRRNPAIEPILREIGIKPLPRHDSEPN